jgi:outer membrane protein
VCSIGTFVLILGGAPGRALAQTPPAPRPGTTAPTTQAPPPLPTAAARPPAPPAVPEPFPPDAKFAFVNMQAIVAESKLGKQGQDEMKALHDKNAVSLNAKAKAIQDMQQQLQSQQGTLSESALQKKLRDLDRAQREATALQQQFTADEQNKNDDLLSAFQEKVLPIIEALRKEKGLWVIFAVQQSDGGLAVASYNSGLDLSPEVVKRLDAAGK